MDLMQRRRVMLATGQKSRLPVEYQEVEWLGLNGAQYCLLQQRSIPHLGFRVKYKVTYRVNSGTPAILSTVSGQLVYFAARTTNVLIRLSGGEQRFYDTSLFSTLNVVYDIAANANSNNITSNGAVVSSVATSSEVSDTGPIYFCKFSGNNTDYLTGYVYFLELYSSNQLIAQLIPCYRKSDSIPGLYDLVNDVFYTNQGRGEFTIGPEVN